MPLLCRNVAKSTRPVEVEKTTETREHVAIASFPQRRVDVCATRPRWPAIAAAFPMR